MSQASVMSPYADGENNFSDDDLDLLQLDDLAELENNAIQFTQVALALTQAAAYPVQPPSRAPAPSSDYGDDFDDEDLDDAVVIDESRSTPAIVPNLAQHISRPTSRSVYAPVSQQGQSQYGSNTSLNNRPRPNIPLFQPSIQTGALPIPQRLSSRHSQASQSDTASYYPTDLIRELEELREKTKLLENKLFAKSGEVSIVRSKQEKELKEHEREVNAIRKINEDRFAKQKKELEAARMTANNAATERDFIRQDLAESARVGKLRAVGRKESNTTPKKKKSNPLRDGFDDDEIEIVSPSKVSPLKFRSRLGTPSRASKRKRKSDDSPAAGLDVQVEEAPEALETKVSNLDESIISTLDTHDDRFDFLGIMLDHRQSKDHVRTIEALGNYRLPSSVGESLAAAVLGAIPSLGSKKPVADLPIQFCEILISLWSRCFDEKYLKPLYLFVDWVSFALELKTTLIAPHIIDNLLPLLQTTVDKVVIPRFYRKPLEDYDALAQVIDVGSYLTVLHMAALGCVPNAEHITRFWRQIRLDFILLCLSQNQPPEHFHQMLRILSTSILRDTFGNIDPGKQTQDAVYIIDRLTYPLFQVPFKPTVDVRLEPEVLLPLRLGCLYLLTSMTRSLFASAALASHQTTLGRLVCLMSDTLDTLYDWRTGYESSGRILTQATRLLYHLVIKHPNINMQQKLTQIHGGPQKYLLVLARLNFSEDDLVLEKGIGTDVQALALEMLESAVTPEEGDKIFEAFLPA
ncbi:DNA repair protein-like protein Rad26 [Calycina marina]|uniref:DNA repair protein-like protein Rad26 n=1 Tax=Calycina marina TaxID=1763456 RepID=A0A9P8CFI5_9HELO|nr:DNA repair protein-like protein Rad26 [Calycina marina]